MRHNRVQKILLVGILALFFMAGCTVSTRTVSPDEELHYDEAYDPSDKKKIVDEFISSLLERTPVPAPEKPPVIVVYDIANRTSDHISTSLITDDIREALIDSGRFRFVSRIQRDAIDIEAAYQHGGNVLSETRVKQWRQTGANFILTGVLRSIDKDQPRQVRLMKKVLKYYNLRLELINLESGLIDWTKSVEIMREASKPFIGW